ncbi:hypothetical protein MLD38_040854 [Melastoma candidum]|nr:hypothetical protein MLD38_040854 [Melastoma candidum]
MEHIPSQRKFSKSSLCLSSCSEAPSAYSHSGACKPCIATHLPRESDRQTEDHTLVDMEETDLVSAMPISVVNPCPSLPRSDAVPTEDEEEANLRSISENPIFHSSIASYF